MINVLICLVGFRFLFGVTAVLFGQCMFLTAAGHNLGVCLVFYLCVLCVCTNAFFYLCAFVLVMLMCMFVRVVLMCIRLVPRPNCT